MSYSTTGSNTSDAKDLFEVTSKRHRYIPSVYMPPIWQGAAII
jgi:hypothetical protein